MRGAGVAAVVEELPELELRHYLNVLRRRWPIVALVTVLAVGAALALAFTSPRIYSASADVLLTDTQQEAVFADGQISTGDPARRINTQITVLESRPIAQKVDRALGADATEVSSVSVAGVGQTDVMRVTVESPDPEVAKKAADLYAATYVSVRRDQQVESLLAAGEQVQKKLDEIQFQIGAQEEGPQRDALSAQYELFKQKLDQVQVDAALKSGGAQVVAKAQVPTSPVKPQPIRDAALAGVLGLLLGIGLAFLAEYLDDKIYVPEDVARYGHGLTVLAEVPNIGGWRDRKAARVVSVDNPNSAGAEAYRSLRTGLQIIGLRRPIQMLLVTSLMVADGKSTTVVNLGVTMARAGRRVVIVDLDLRRPRLGDFFDLEDVPGFTSVLVGDAPLSEALVEIDVAPGVPPLQLLTSGPVPPNPSELLGATRAVELLASLESVADLVIVDSPPLIPVTDALVLSGRADGVLLVVAAGQTRRRHLGRAVELLQQAEAPLLGAVLNATTAQHRRYGYGYGYGSPYAYGDKKSSKGRMLSRS
jgi:capsular exopolysaccharide synthesis family protein